MEQTSSIQNLSRNTLFEIMALLSINDLCHLKASSRFFRRNTQDILIEKLRKRAITQMDMGFEHIISLTENGDALGCGSNRSGQLGLGTEITAVDIPTVIPTMNKIKKVVAMRHATFFIKFDHTVWFSGSGSYCLGLGESNTFTPTQIPGLDNVEDIYVQELWIPFETCSFILFVLKRNGTVWICGPLANINDHIKFKKLEDPLKGCYHSEPIQVPNLPFVKKMTFGNYHFVFITTEGIFVWGDNTRGQLGMDNKVFKNIDTPILNPNLKNVRDIIAITDTTYLLNNDGSVSYCGKIFFEKDETITSIPTPIPNLNNIKSFTILRHHLLFSVTETGEVLLHGNIQPGLFGLHEDSKEDSIFISDPIPILKNIKTVFANESNVAFLGTDSSIKIFGSDDYFQTGSRRSTDSVFCSEHKILGKPVPVPSLNNWQVAIKLIKNSNNNENNKDDSYENKNHIACLKPPV